ncbi:MAG: sortase domain-bontaining protein, partial [Acetanaerobacterium sp.]
SFSTKEDDMLWQVFATFTTDTDFYYIEPEPTDDDFMFIVSEAYERSEHYFDVDVTPEDKILTLSTCTYKYGRRTDQRFVVMAKLLPGKEATPADVYQNENPKLPSFVK